MNKNRILFVISVIMIVVILLAVAKKMDILEFGKKDNSTIMQDNDEKKSDSKDNSEGVTIASNVHVKDAEDIRKYEMGEEAICGNVLPDEDGTMQNRGLTYVVNSVLKADRIENIPDNLNGMIAGIEHDGYPREENTFLLVDVTIKNTGKTSIQHYINCSDIVKESDISEPISHLCCYDEYENYMKRDYFCITLEPESEFCTKLIFTLKSEDVEEELYMKINPNGVTNVYDGAAMIKLVVKDG